MLFFHDYGLICLKVNVAVGLCTGVVNIVSWYVCNHLPTIKQEPVSPGHLYMVAMQFVLTKWDVVSDRPIALVRVAHGTVGNIQNDGVKLLHGISFPPGVHRAVVVCWCSFKCRPSGSCPVVSAGGQVSGILAECRVLAGVTVVSAPLLTLAEFNGVLAVHRELKSSSLDCRDGGVPFTLEGIECLASIAPLVGRHEKGERDVVVIADAARSLYPDGSVLRELTQQSGVCGGGVHHVCERGANLEDFLAVLGGDGVIPPVQVFPANAEVVARRGRDAEQLHAVQNGLFAYSAITNFHGNLLLLGDVFLYVPVLFDVPLL